MKLLADENIPASVVTALQDDGYDIVEVRSKSPGISDREVIPDLRAVRFLTVAGDPFCRKSERYQRQIFYMMSNNIDICLIN